MRAIWLEVPESFLEERRRYGQDKKDELWDGVLHMVPPPKFVHEDVVTRLVIAFTAIAERRGLRCVTAGVFRGDKNYRVPDLTLGKPEHVSERGFEGAELIIEVLSPNDESRDKLPFYASVGVREVWLIEPRTRTTELLALRDDHYAPVPWIAGRARSPVLGIELELVATAEGPTLELHDGCEVTIV